MAPSRADICHSLFKKNPVMILIINPQSNSFPPCNPSLTSRSLSPFSPLPIATAVFLSSPHRRLLLRTSTPPAQPPHSRRSRWKPHGLCGMGAHKISRRLIGEEEVALDPPYPLLPLPPTCRHERRCCSSIRERGIFDFLIASLDPTTH